MHKKLRVTKFSVATVMMAIVLGLCTASYAQDSTITFDNQSGEPALVKLIGPTPREAEVLATGKTTVTVGPGLYHIRVRYGTEGKYRYTKGEEFDVTESSTTRPQITITLHKVPQGNYETDPITSEDFDIIPPSRATTYPVKLTSGRWSGRTDTKDGFLELSFVVDAKNARVQEIKTKGGWKMVSFPGWSWPSHDKASADIQADGSFIYKDGRGNLIRGRFTSAKSAHGEVPARIQAKANDGSLVKPPSSWHASPDTAKQRNAAQIGAVSDSTKVAPDISKRYLWKTKWEYSSAADGITVKDTKVFPDGKRQQSFSGSIPIVMSQIVVDAPGSKNVKIEIDPTAGSTWYAGLIFETPCVLGILEDFTLVADREGIRARDREGNYWRSQKATLKGKEVILFSPE